MEAAFINSVMSI